MLLDIPSSLFGDISTEEFLAEYWQKKPLFVRNAWPGFVSPVTPDDLKSITCRDDVEGRLILEEGGDYPWELRFGPFDRQELNELPNSHWALLVQNMDRLHPEVGRMLEVVNFLPNWRLDDIMISYAPGAGGVGAHIDNYDVFLLQGSGKRRWQINSTPVEDVQLIPDLDVSVLVNFEADEEWVVGPGDMLYLPPRIAHFGVALEDCITYSIGCRAPSKEGILTGFLDHLMSTASADETFFSDVNRELSHSPGTIDAQIKEFARRALTDVLSDDAQFERWLGEHLTEAQYIEPTESASISSEEINDALATGSRLRARSVSRVAHDRLTSGQLVLYVSGESIDVPTELEAFIAALCRQPGITGTDIPAPGSTTHDAAVDLLRKLLNDDHFMLQK